MLDESMLVVANGLEIKDDAQINNIGPRSTDYNTIFFIFERKTIYPSGKNGTSQS